jgi:DNA-binding transcriptional LysR family regulator
VQLTDFGKVLYEHVKVMARLDDHAAAEIRMLKASHQKAIRIGTGFAWWSLFMRDIFQTYRRDHGDVSLHIDVCSSLDGLQNLLSGDIGCFVGTKVDSLNPKMGFVFEHLFTVEDGYFARKDHPLGAAEHTLADIAQFPRLDVAPFVNRHLGLIERAAIDQMGSERSHGQTGLCTTNSMTAGIDMLQDTDAILVYPILCEPFFQRHDVIMLDVVDRKRTLIEIGIYRLAEKKPDQHLSQILNHIRRSAKTMIDKTPDNQSI